MSPTTIRLLGATLLLAGLGLAGLARQKTIQVESGSLHLETATCAPTVGAALQELALLPGPADRLTPPLATPLKDGLTIRLTRAAQVVVWAGPPSRPHTLLTTASLPANWLAQAGLRLFPGDQVLLEGLPVDPAEPAAPAPRYHLTLVRAHPLTLTQPAGSQTLLSRAPTLAQALWEAGIPLHPADSLSSPPASPLADTRQITWTPSRPLTIRLGNRVVHTRSAAATVGEALTEAGLPLQGLDTSQPPPEAPLPADGEIRLVRVTERLEIEQEPLAFSLQYQPLPDVELDQQRIVQAGEYGFTARRVRITYADGVETARQVEAEWVAAPPKPRIVGYGTKIVLRTLQTPAGPLQYWRAVEMYAVSYSPSSAGGSITAAGLPLRKGLVAVDTVYIPLFTRLYVPGYGEALAADIGGGVKGRMIDLGYSDADYVGWHQNVIVYFLAPAPPADQIVWIFP